MDRREHDRTTTTSPFFDLPQSWADRNHVLAHVRANGLELQFASHDLRSDRDVVLAAVQNNGDAIQYAGEALQRDRDLWLAA
eukprot:scaffold7444_cov764-Pinguiococcus_pyrenoidosus.AAC.1